MADPIPVRITVLDTWNESLLVADPNQSIGELKAQALAAIPLNTPPEEYLVKYRGAELSDSVSLAESGVTAHAPLIVLRRRRAPSR